MSDALYRWTGAWPWHRKRYQQAATVAIGALLDEGYVIVPEDDLKAFRDAYVLQEVRGRRFTPTPESREIVRDIMRKTRDDD